MPPLQSEQQTAKHAKVVFKYSSPLIVHTLTLSNMPSTHTEDINTAGNFHFPKLPKLVKASCLGWTTAGVME